MNICSTEIFREICSTEIFREICSSWAIDPALQIVIVITIQIWFNKTMDSEKISWCVLMKLVPVLKIVPVSAIDPAPANCTVTLD